MWKNKRKRGNEAQKKRVPAQPRNRDPLVCFAFLGSLRSSENSLALAHLHLTARRERQIIDWGIAPFFCVRGKKSGSLPNQETGIRSFILRFRERWAM